MTTCGKRCLIQAVGHCLTLYASGKDWACTRIPAGSKTPDTHHLLAHHKHTAKKHVVQRTRDPQVVGHIWWSHVKNTRRAAQGLLTLGFSVLLVSSPVHHGRIRDGQFAIVLLSDHWPPSSRHEDSCEEREKKPNNVKSEIWYKWTYLGKKSRLRDLEKRPVVAKGEGR